MFDKIIETNSKKISIQITNRGEVILKKPKNYSQKLLENFIELKQKWIEEKRRKALELVEKYKDVIEYKTILVLGNENQIIYDSKCNKISPKKMYVKNRKSLITTIKKYANEIIIQKATYFSNKIGVKPLEIKIENAKKRWGVCTSKKVIKINFRACMVDEKCLDYIIIHELLHLKEFNHSKNFWLLVKKYVPNFSEIKKQLKEYGILLDLYR